MSDGRRAAPAIAAGVALAAFAWGLAEATLFFIVADVLLTFIALRLGLRVGLIAALAAALGAAVGGIVMRQIGATDPAMALAMLRAVPFLPDHEIERGLAGMAQTQWPLAMLRGSVTGIPYKVYAVGAGLNDIPAALFAIVTVPARLARFAAATILLAWLGDRLEGHVAFRSQALLLAAFWILFYGEFWLRWSGWERAILH